MDEAILNKKGEKKMFKKIIFLFLLLALAGATGCKKTEEQDPVLEAVDDTIALFLADYASSYVNDEENVYDMYVVAAIAALEESGYGVSLSDYAADDAVQDYYSNLPYQTNGEIVKGVLVGDFFEVNYLAASNALSALEEADVDPYSYTNVLMALKKANLNPTLQSILSAKIIDIKTEDYRDADYAGAGLMATYEEDINREALYGLFTENITATGVSAWGNPNSSSTASVILGLVAIGENPRGEAYQVEEKDLIMMLLDYEEAGAFYYKQDDEQLDLMFSTPQAFAALVAYKIYHTTQEAFCLFLSE